VGFSRAPQWKLSWHEDDLKLMEVSFQAIPSSLKMVPGF
jgi:hypothetical protein